MMLGAFVGLAILSCAYCAAALYQIMERMTHAGELMLMWHVPGTRPAGYKSTMPDTVQDYMDAYCSHSDAPIRYQLESWQVERMERIYHWIGSVPNHHIRRVLMAASLHNPTTGRRKYSWKRMGKLLRVSDKTAKRYYQDGLSRIAGMLSEGHLDAV